MSKRLLKIFVPWVITCVALYIAFRGIEWNTLLAHLGSADPAWLAVAIALTCGSYLLRAWRWQFMFPDRVMGYFEAFKVLILGFFMNNVLPARTGEFVRAHAGAKLAGEKRTLVLATIASERLADGLMLSLMFVAFAAGIGDQHVSNELFYVALAFGAAALGVLLLLILRQQVFKLAEALNARFAGKASDYTFDRIKVFIEGLSPLANPRRMPAIWFLSAVVWSIELTAYFAIARAFSAQLPFASCVLFMVSVNFGSLIPAAPGGIGVIEAIGSNVLVSIGLPREQALTMVIAQHLIQYVVVGIPGAIFTLTWRGKLALSESEIETQASPV